MIARNEERIVWVLVVPLGLHEAERLVRTFRTEQLGIRDEFIEKWDVAECKEGFSAIINRQAGTRHTHEMKLAETLSHKISGRLYLVYVDAEFFGSDGVEIYEGGRYTGEDDSDPYEFLASFGCSFLKRKGPSGRRAHESKTVIVVEGGDTNEAARALGFDSPPQTPSLAIDEGSLGPVIHSETIGDLSMFTSRLTKAFSGRDIYEVSTGPIAGRFRLRLVKDGKNVGVFEHHSVDDASDRITPKLDSVKGQKTPEGIAASLGIPLNLLNL